MTDKITMIELFSGIGAQERALRQLRLPYEVVNTCDCDANAVLSYAAMRWDLEKEMETFEFPSQDKMIEELQAKNLGYDFQKGKHSITKRTSINKLKQYYIADKLSSNLGDISKVEKLPYADVVTYSFCCQDLSVAGKGEGMKLNCDECGHSWLVDFEHPENNNVCPNCGNTNIASTRSGLLGQVQRLLSVAKESDTPPKYLLLENVKNLVGKKFKPQFDAWVKWLDSIGYSTYWKVLNAKNYGIPQNRERVFAISIRKDIDNSFTFPEEIPLTTRLKDILETNVAEKYYLPDERIEKILNSSFMMDRKKNTNDINVIGNYMPSGHDASRVVDIDGVAPCVKENHGTVTAIAEPQVERVGQASTGSSQCGIVYGTDGLAPTLIAGCHGYAMGYIAEEQATIEPNTCLIQPKDRDYKKKNQSREVHIESKNDGVSHALRTNGETMVIEPFIVASRGRNPENPSDRTTGSPTEQRFEPNTKGVANTITTVQKDNYVCEPQVLRAERTEYGKAIRKQYEAGEIYEKIGNMREMKPRTDGVSNTITTLLKDNYVVEPIIYDDYNSRIPQDQDAITTLTTNCGASAERNGVKIIEPVICENEKIAIVEDQFPGSRDARIYKNYSPTLRASNCSGLKVADGNEDVNPIRLGNIYGEQFGTGYAGNVWDENAISPTIMTMQGGNRQPLVVDNIKWRIRKLTAKECLRLMGFTDSDADKSAKYVSASAQYKQSGNSICTSCLVALFSSLLLKDGYKSEVWSKYLIDFNS